MEQSTENQVQETGVTEGDAGSQTQIPGEDTGGTQDDAGSNVGQTSEEIIALQKARDENAKKARLAKEEAQRAKEDARYYQGLAERQLLEEEEDPDEPLTRRELEAKLEQERLKQQQALRSQRVVQSVNTARERYKDDPILTYDQAYEKAQEMVASGEWDKGTLTACLSTADAAKTLYNMVNSLPEVQQKRLSATQTKAVEDTVNAINQNQNQPGTISDLQGGGDTVLDEVKKWSMKSSADFFAERDRVLNRSR